MNRRDEPFSVLTMMTTTCTYQCEFHVASLAPPIAPGVADDPVPTWDIDANDVDGMVDVVYWSAAGVDAALVGRPVTRIKGN